VDRFAGRVVLVTGGGSGIGRATCERLAAEGATVWVVDADGGRAQSAADAIPGARCATLDVSDADGFGTLIDHVMGHDERVDVLVNNAGVTLAGSVWETDPVDWARVIAVNLGGAFNGSRAVFPAMIAAGRGAIVNTASDAGLVGWPGQAAYCASKGGVVALTRAAAMDGAPHGVRVNAVCPAFTNTPLVASWIAQQDDPDRARIEIAAQQPLGRVAEPAEIAAAIAFLASDEARFITGIALPVDGGVTAQ
jgi:NAD(P)-dependent dehydrogenase (short-subunit alcohol dehydrogenase family)